MSSSEDPAPVTSPDARRDVLRLLHRPHRVTALADGVFAIAMTLLALEIRIPDDVANEEEFTRALGPLLGAIVVFVLGFFITAQYWIGHHRVMSYVHTVDRRGLGRSVGALVGICALPVAISLITHWGEYPEAVAVASGILIVTSLLSVRLYAHVLRPELADVDPGERRRILVAPLFNVGIYVITVPVAFVLYRVFGVSAAWSALLWFLLGFNGRLGNLVAGRAAAERSLRPPSPRRRTAAGSGSPGRRWGRGGPRPG